MNDTHIMTVGVNERIRLGPDITILVASVRCREEKVRIGVEAPRSVPVHREEIARRIAREGPRR